MVGYKVCQVKLDGNGQEVYYSATDLGRSIVYQSGSITKGMEECGPLAVFDYYDDADHFTKHWRNHHNCRNSHLKIFKCKYKQSNDDELWYVCESGDYRMRYSCFSQLPSGTVLADEVTLLECVTEYKEGVKITYAVE